MSKTVDERVVSMQFDNKQFEQNVKTSMSTIEKLKQSLKFKNSDEGLKNIESSVKRVDMKGLGSSVEAVTAKFSALQVIGVTALANITNSAVNAGKRMISALTIDPIRTGFQEYETQINAVQTILANTQSKGSTLKDVNAALDELNKYADLTIYNFTEMTRNIGTFTAAGVDLDTSVNAIKGIANLAAVSGSNAQQASTAMYQLSQALASGTVKLMDWNSVVNAGMGGQVFQDALKETARVHGIAIDSMIDKQGSFRETLSEGWLTSEILTETLQKFTLTTEGLTEEQIKANREMLRAKGYTEDQIDEIFKLGETATNAATKVKTFTQLWDVLKEAAQSGWAQTWRLIVGDFEEAKSLFTPLSDFFTGIINNVSEARNKLLESALGKSFTSIGEKITNITKPAEKAAEAITNTVDAVTDLGSIVDDVIFGKFGNGEDRFNALTEAGQNYYRIQNKVNETLGDSFRYTDEQIAAQDKLLGSKEETVEVTKEETEETSNLTEEKKKLIKEIASMTEEQMRDKGYTEEQIEAFKELRITAEKLGIPLNDFIDNLDQINGRWLLLNSFKNIGKNLVKIFTSIGKAWREIFPPIQSDQLFNIIAGFHKLTSNLIISDENADKLRRTFKGLFAILDLVTSIVGGGFKLAFKTVSYILSYFDLNILDVTAAIGDALVWFRDFVKENNIFVKALDTILPYLEDFAIGIRDWIEGIKDADNIPKYIIEGLVNGLKSGVKTVVSAVIELGKSIIKSICNVLGIHSPSTEFFEIGKNIIQGLINGLKYGISSVFDFMVEMGSKLIELLKKIDFGAVFAIGLGIGSLYIINKLANVLEVLSGPLKGISDILSSISGVFDAISSNIKASAFKKKSQAILNMAISIGILAASIYVLAKLDTGKLWMTIGALAALSGIILLLSFAASKMNSIGDFGKSSITLISIAGSLLILSLAMKNLSTINGEDVPKTLGILTAMILGMSAILLVFGKFVKGPASMNMDKAGKMILKISLAILIMVGVVKMAGKLDPKIMTKGLLFIGALELFVISLVAVSKLAGEHASQAGKMILKIAVALAIMVGVVKLAGNLEPEEVDKGLLFIGALELFVISLVAVSKLAGRDASKAGSMILKISVALLIMVEVVKLAGKLESEALIKGIAVISILETFMIALIAVSKLAGKDAAKAGTMLLEMAASLFIITGVLYLLGKMNAGDTARALGIISVLEILFGGLIAVTKLAQNCKGTLITLTVCIAILISAVTALTLVNQDKLKTATTSISMIIGAFAALVAATGTLKSSKSAIKTLVPLVGIMAAIASVLSIMSLLNVEPSIQTASAISILLTSMASSMFILSQATYVSKNNIATLAIIGAVVAEIAVILGIMDAINVEPSIQTATALSTMLLAMSGALVIVGIVGTYCPGAMAGIESLVVLIGAMGLMMTAIGGLNELTGGEITRFVNESIPILQDFGEGLGNFIGGLVGGVVAGALDSLSGIGTSLTEFIDEIQPFIDSVSEIDPVSMEGGKALADMLLALTASNLLDGLANLIGGRDMSELGSQMVSFGEALVDFSNTVKGNVDEAAVQAAANAGSLMAEMQSKIVPSGGVIQWFTGEKDMSTFGTQLEAFGTAIVNFSDTVKDNIDESAVQAAANAGNIMAEMQKNLEPTGGVIQEFTGEKDMSTFGSQLEAYGEAIVNFSNKLAEGTIDESAVQAAANAGNIMAEMQKNIEPIGGVIQAFTGDKDMATFGSQIEAYGEAIVNFSEKVSGDSISEASVEKAKNVGLMMTELDSAIPSDKWFDGKVNLDDFGDKIESFGESMVDFSDTVSDIDDTAVKNTTDAAQKMVDMCKTLTEYGGSFTLSFVDFTDVGNAIRDYYGTVKDVDSETLSKTLNSVKGLLDLIASMDGISTEGVSQFKSAVDELSGIDLTGLADAFDSYSSEMTEVGSSIVTAIKNGMTTKQTTLLNAASTMINALKKAFTAKAPLFITAGTSIMTKFISGIKNEKTKVTSAFANALASSVTRVRNYRDSFYTAGGYLVKGFADGITDNTYKAEAKAKAMAKAAYEAAKEALDINSPSKVFRRLAYSVPEGFAQGVYRRTDMAVNSTKEMANSAIYATKKSLSHLGDLISSDIDTQPTIRPVLDLSDVNSGVGTLNGMFGMRPSVGVLSNIGAINSMMNNRQNGSNSDVISAIDKLGKTLGNTGTTSYTINGITYDDGSNISDAVKTLVRAARVERRM